jgi:hypothetical protein
MGLRSAPPAFDRPKFALSVGGEQQHVSRLIVESANRRGFSFSPAFSAA